MRAPITFNINLLNILYHWITRYKIVLFMLIISCQDDNDQIDVFQTPYTIYRQSWHYASRPINTVTGQFYSNRKRALLNWYNPYIQILTKSIWPNPSYYGIEMGETMDILVLEHRPRVLHDNLPHDSIWSSIVIPLQTEDIDQSESEYFGLWIKGTHGLLTIDLGKISEDINGDSLLNTEDEWVAGMPGNALLDEGEDIGLDGCSDEYEDGWGGCIDTFYVDVVDNPLWADIVYTGSDKDLQDPNGDNWSYKEGSSDYSYINGSESNQILDSEDINGNWNFDTTNDYFTITIDLSDTTYLAGETKRPDGSLTGWKLLMIPHTEFTQPYNGLISWNNIQFLRLSISGVGTGSDVMIAQIKFHD